MKIKKIVSVLLALTSGLSLFGCEQQSGNSTESSVTEKESNISVDTIDFKANLWLGDSVSVPDAFSEKGEVSYKVVEAETGAELVVQNGTVTPDDVGRYEIIYTAADEERRESFYVMEKGVLDDAEYEGQELLWDSNDREGPCTLKINRDLEYVVSGKQSYKMTFDEKSNWPGISLSAKNFASNDFSEFDAVRFAFYNNTEHVQKLSMKLTSDDGIIQTVDSISQAFGLQPKQWVWVGVSIDALTAYNPTFAPTDISKLRIYITRQYTGVQEVYVDDIRLIKYGAPKDDYSSLKIGEEAEFRVRASAEESAMKEIRGKVTETLITGFENRTDATANEPYQNITCWESYENFSLKYSGKERTDSGKGLMYFEKPPFSYDRGGIPADIVTFEGPYMSNKKLLMQILTEYDFTAYDCIAVDIFNPSDTTAFFYLALTSEYFLPYNAYSEGISVEPDCWGTIYYSIANAVEKNIEIEYLRSIDIGCGDSAVKSFYADNLRLVTVHKEEAE